MVIEEATPIKNSAVNLDCTQAEWGDILRTFRDGNIYQTWAYGAIRWGSANLRHVILRESGDVLAAAQVRIVRTGIPRLGIAYVMWGPMWRPRGRPENVTILARSFRVLREEFGERRGLFVRVVPNEEDENNDAIKDILVREGFRWRAHHYKTFILDLVWTEEELRRSMGSTWRKHLHKAERAGFTIDEGTGMELFEKALDVYQQMHSRKGFEEHVDMKEYGHVQRELDQDMKMRIVLCKMDGEIIAALVWSAIGEVGVPILAATGDKGLGLNALNLLHWRMIQRMKEMGCTRLNLGGTSKEGNPGGYIWKSGLSGKLGREVGQLGKFDYCANSMISCLIRSADVLRKSYRKVSLAWPKAVSRMSRMTHEDPLRMSVYK